MANLVLQEFKCVTETDEAGWDSPYFVIFTGRRNGGVSSTVNITRRNNWDNNVGSGGFVKPNITVGSGVDTDTLVLVALMEEDIDPDITGEELANVRAWMDVWFKAYGSVQGKTLNQLGSDMKPLFIDSLVANRYNDELVKVMRLMITTSHGALPAIHFWGAGGHYWARFRMA